MVRRGGRSKGCATCRQRKIKCDESLPNCLNCEESGRDCPGPLTGLLVVNQNTTPVPAQSKHVLYRWRRISFPGSASRNPKSSKSKLADATGPSRDEDTVKVSKHGKLLPKATKPSDNTASRFSPVRMANAIGKPQTILSATNLDPFGSLAADLTPKDQVLVSCYLENLARAIPRMWPFGSGGHGHTPTEWSWLLPMTFTDQAVFHAILAASATYSTAFLSQRPGHSSSLIAQDKDKRAFFHKAKACRLMNERLQSKEDAVSDASISAVFTLMGCEIMAEAIDSYLTHQKGLTRMIQLRGGLEALPQFLALLITVSDVETHTSLLQKPYFPIYHGTRSTKYSPKLQKRSWGEGALHSRFLDPELSSILEDGFIEIIQDIWELMEQCTSAVAPSKEWSDDIYYKCYSIQHRLLSYEFNTILPSGDEVRDLERTVQLVCRTATCIFWSARILETGNAIIDVAHNFKAVSLLYTIFTQQTSTSYPQHISEAFLWALFTAGYIAKGVHRQLFVQRIKEFSGQMEIVTFSEVRKILGAFLYLEDELFWPYHKLWEEVIQTRDEELGAKDNAEGSRPTTE